MSKGFLRPSNQTEGTGLLNDVDVTWVGLAFKEWDYNGSVPEAVPALEITMEVDGDDSTQVQYFSAGKLKDWVPSADGTTLEAVGSATGINKTTNLAILMNSLVEAGYPEEEIDDDCTAFIGLKCHMVRVPAPKRSGLPETPRADGKVFEKTNLIVSDIISMPGEAKAAKGGAKGKATKATTKGKAAAGGEEDSKDKATQVVLDILSDNPKGLDKKKLGQMVFVALKSDPARNSVLQLVFSDEFLNDGPWTFDGKTVQA